MKGLVSIGGLTAFALLSGCVVYQMDKTPPCDGLSDTARAECKFKPECLLKCEMKMQERMCFGKKYAVPFGEMKEETLTADFRSEVSEAISGSGCFSSCQALDSEEAREGAVQIQATCAFSEIDGGPGSALASVFTLTLYPARTYDYCFNFAFDVQESGAGKIRQYYFKETVRKRFGLIMLLASPFMGNGSYEETFAAMNRKVMNNLFVKMQQDGFFSAEGRDKAAAAKTDVVEAAKKTVAARRKELEDLKKAGIIDEVEFAAEMKKLECR